MAWIRSVPPAEATGRVQELYETDMRRAGRRLVPKITQVFGISPRILEAVNAMRNVVIYGGSLLGRRREDMIAVVCSGLNRCGA
jgi:hypothetical protein